MKLEITIPGRVQAKQRHNTSALKRCRACNRTTMARQCRCGSEDLTWIENIPNTPKNTVLYENLVAMCAREAMEKAGINRFVGPVTVAARFCMEIPASRIKKLKEGDPHTQRPDIDNMQKSLLDGLNGVAWADDSVISKIVAEKVWAEKARCEVIIDG